MQKIYFRMKINVKFQRSNLAFVYFQHTKVRLFPRAVLYGVLVSFPASVSLQTKCAHVSDWCITVRQQHWNGAFHWSFWIGSSQRHQRWSLGAERT